MIHKLGKIGKINQKTRGEIAQIAMEKGIDYCELGISTSCYRQGHAPAHRHPRVWYRQHPELLSDFRQWLAACTPCHTRLDDRSLTSEDQSEEIFMRIRGPE